MSTRGGTGRGKAALKTFLEGCEQLGEVVSGSTMKAHMEKVSEPPSRLSRSPREAQIIDLGVAETVHLLCRVPCS